MRLVKLASTLLLGFSSVIAAQDQSSAAAAAGPASPRYDSKHYFKVGGSVLPPHVLNSPQPKSPSETCKITHKEVAILWVAINEEGTVDRIKMVRSAGKDLDQKATEAVQQWTFAPATRHGQAVPVQFDVEVNFNLC